MSKVTATFDSTTHKIVPIEPTYEMVKAMLCGRVMPQCSQQIERIFQQAKSDLRIAIAAAPEYQECSQWVSVCEQLPPKCIDVLCQPFLSFSNVAWHDGACWRVTEYIKGFGETHIALEDGFITHWMPLPPAPEGDKP